MPAGKSCLRRARTVRDREISPSTRAEYYACGIRRVFELVVLKRFDWASHLQVNLADRTELHNEAGARHGAHPACHIGKR
jgi:hypothetical protein